MPRRRPTARPAVTPLEDRAVPNGYFWNGGGNNTNWSNPNNWDGGVVPGSVAGDTDVRVTFNPGTSGTTVMDLAGLTLGSVLSLSTAAVTVQLDTSLTLDGAPGATPNDVATTGPLTFWGGPNFGGVSDLILTDTVDVDAEAGETVEIMTRVTGTGGLRKTGGGELTLRTLFGRANTYTGDTRVDNGVLSVRTDTNDQGLSANVIVGDGTGVNLATLQLLSSGEIPDAATLTVNRGGQVVVTNFSIDDVTTLQFQGGAVRINFGSDFLVRDGGVIRVGPVDPSGGFGSTQDSPFFPTSGPGSLLLGDGTITVDVADGPDDDDLVVNVPVGVLLNQTTPTSLRKTGTGTLTITAVTVAYTGPTLVDDGVLKLSEFVFDGMQSPAVEVGDGTGTAGSAVLRIGKTFGTTDNVGPSLTVRGDGRVEVGEDVVGTVPDLVLGSADGGGGIDLGRNSRFGVRPGGTIRVPAAAASSSISGTGQFVTDVRARVTVDDNATLVATAALVRSQSTDTSELVKDGGGTLRLEGASSRATDVPISVKAGVLAVGERILSPVTATDTGFVNGGLAPGAVGVGSLVVSGGRYAPRAGLSGGVQGDPASAFLADSAEFTSNAAFVLPVTSATTGGYTVPTRVSGAVKLSSVSLVVVREPLLTPLTPLPGETYLVIDNTGAGPVQGTFAGLPEGATVIGESGETYTITYAGGDGNDVVLRLRSASTSPSTARPARETAVGAGAGAGTVRFLNADRTERFAVTPFGADFTGGVRTAAADFTGDGVADLVVGTGPGRATRVRVLDGVTQAELFAVDPFEASFVGGVYVAAGDLNGDGRADLVITPDQGGGPRARVFSGATGFLQLADFFGINDPNFRGGARAALGDVTGDGKADLVVAAGFGGGPRVAVFDGVKLAAEGALADQSTARWESWKPFGDFLTFEEGLRNGSFVAAGDVDGDGKAELIAAGGPGGGPRVSAFSGAGLLSGSQTRVADFFAGDVNNRGGVRVVAKDLDGDARADVVVGSGDGAGSRVTGYAGATLTGGSPPELFGLDGFAGFAGGVFVG